MEYIQHNILVSAIITTHNRRDLLPRAIKSVILQTYKPLECIVVDDASDDGTDEYCEELSGIRYIRIEKKDSKGGNYARNLGIKAATGDYIAFLDDDDYWLSNKIDLQMEFVYKKNAKFVYCSSRLEKIGQNGTIFQDTYPQKEYYGNMSKKILETICCTTSSILVEKRSLQKVGYFDESLRFWQEYELTIRLAQIIPFYYVYQPLVVYRVNPSDKNRLTNKYYDWQNAVKYIYNKHKNLYGTLGLKAYIQTKVLYYSDACQRAKTSGLKYIYYRNRFYRFIYLFLPRVKKVLEKVVVNWKSQK